MPLSPEQPVNQPPPPLPHVPQPPPPYGHTHHPNQYAAPGMAVNQGPGSYAERLHSFGKSPMFLLGAVLFIVGGGLGALINFTVFSIFNLALVALPIIGLLLVYIASKTPQLPEKSLTGLTLFKVSTIIEMVIFCLVIALVLIGVIIGVILGFAVGDTVIAVFIFIVAAVTVGILALFLFLYYVSILRIIGGIKTGLTTNVFTPLKGVMPLLVMLIIMAVFSFIGTLTLIGWAGAGSLDILMDDIFYFADVPWEVRSMFDGIGLFANMGTLVLSSVLGVMRTIGAIICVIVVYQFNRSIVYGGGYGAPPLPPQQW